MTWCSGMVPWCGYGMAFLSVRTHYTAIAPLTASASDDSSIWELSSKSRQEEHGDS
ncbi:hypothetical protein HMPREF9141_0040 [Prevotella multiformis DSM 16608]|uniref:Uncharacterized protein n=1 Tax=Prevotella multiformis DSM 16608 TaxID=888743 RepID=F0F374_9BACT|nr:hypothetical protein HMPREF9141_0040 [Prevotella multiformis DSM 16608]